MIQGQEREQELWGFKKIYISKYNKKSSDFSKLKIQVLGAGKVSEVFRITFKED